ncbi:phosphotransferase enzyme family protein [Mucilaginibacter lappiensis]|uniref:Ser/Thr protein kinase RdoA (MazF antagonist) n=1 Tax=Mucilaginibacter lappiensis TaxID=354630 RepID=A0A1N7E5V5_9SPHI|nr:phosphotransferase [Mucilaginibacter lappiensis]MBB6111674.1 Ser/Thr protein kinase RdoA (MazF antagonist) [Mucilaginibacter lappiensis]MBB6131080.1 Ser/Thr protein kinase RdoA (MazF antagonist) [Mucilaginibacter lappiensis]SIR83457.1 Ser/Thr protein kinase RdoA involved in Cpx stress response, MazF antagonist [Mucilaginibacter lappiensis]
MTPFPAQYSTLSALALKDYVAAAYGINLISCKYLLRGVSDTYILEATDVKYILKIYRDRHRSLTEIQGEVELLNMLKEYGANVSYPLTDIFGSQIQKFDAAEGTRYGIVFSYALGKPVLDLNDEQLKTVGRQMAAVHNITSVVKLNYKRKAYTTDSTLIQPLKTLKPAFAELPGEYIYLKETVMQVIQKLNTFDTKKFSYGYCQYDFLPKNFHFDDAGQITFFDFDFAGQGYLANDLMSFFVHFFMHVFTGKLTDDEADRMFKIFVKAYREVRPVSDQEIKAIPYLGVGFWIFYLGFQYENFDDWSNPFFGPKFIKDRVALIKVWVDKYCEF